MRTLRKADLWRELEARIQAMNEPTIDYYYAKIGLCRSLSLSFAETRDYILEGLRSQQQADWVSSRRQADTDELLSDLRDWEKLRAKRQQLFQPATTNRTNTEQPAPYVNSAVPRNADKPSAAPMNVPTSLKTSTTTSNDTEATSTISCYNCRGRGHISRDCPRPQRPMKCSGCGSDQHRRSGCPAPTVGKSKKW